MEHENHRERRRGERLVFVGGCPRSGTTLLQSILDSHPDICGGPEFDRIPDIVELRGKLHESVGSGRISVYRSKEDIDREVGAFVERLLFPYAEDRGCIIVSEKTPWNVLVFRELLEIFPEAEFIFCIRDPRAVIASMIEVGKRAREIGSAPPVITANIPAIIETIKTTNKAGFEAAKRSDRVLTVIYERLVTEPEEETREICDFLKVPWSEEMIRPGEKEHDGSKVLDGVWHYPEMYNKNPDTRRVDRWQDLLTSTEEAMIAAAFGEDEDLAALGYRFSSDGLPLTRRAAGNLRLKSRAFANSSLFLLLTIAKRIPIVKQVGGKLLSQAKEI